MYVLFLLSPWVLLSNILSHFTQFPRCITIISNLIIIHLSAAVYSRNRSSGRLAAVSLSRCQFTVKLPIPAEASLPFVRMSSVSSFYASYTALPDTLLSAGDNYYCTLSAVRIGPGIRDTAHIKYVSEDLAASEAGCLSFSSTCSNIWKLFSSTSTYKENKQLSAGLASAADAEVTTCCMNSLIILKKWMKMLHRCVHSNQSYSNACRANSSAAWINQKTNITHSLTKRETTNHQTAEESTNNISIWI